MKNQLERSVRLHILLNRRRRHKVLGEKSAASRITRLEKGLGFAASLLLTGTLLVAGIYFARLTVDLPSLETLPALLDPLQGALLQPTRFYDRTGTQVIYTLENSGIIRRILPLDPSQPEYLSPRLVNATLALYDPEFWSNPGFSLRNLQSGRPQTIAERLVNQLLLSQEVNSPRKAWRMRILSAQVVAKFGRTRTLEWFLNSAYFGHLAYGVDAAAWLYLNKSAANLNLADVALLMAAYEAPALNPIDAPAAALEGKQLVLDHLLANGVINNNEYQQASLVKTNLKGAWGQVKQDPTSFIHLAIQQLERHFSSQQVERGGMIVVTSQDFDLQKQVQCGLQAQLLLLEGRAEQTDGNDCKTAALLPTLPPSEQVLPTSTSASALVMDPKNGQILALVGELNGKGQQSPLLDHQPGSLLTPFVAVAAFSRGKSPASLVWDIAPVANEEEAAHPNPDEKYHGPVRLRTALANDFLAPLGKILGEIGVQTVWQLAEPLGLVGLNQEKDPSGLIYSGGHISLLQAAQAYSVLANQGLLVGMPFDEDQSLEPGTLLQVRWFDGADKTLELSPLSRSVLTNQLAFLVNHVFVDEQARQSSLGHPNPLEIGRPVAAKIGQMDGKAQGWTVGYTPLRLVAVWMGAPEGIIAKQRLDIRAPAGVWNAVMKYTSQQLPAVAWEEPPGVSTIQVCDPSGLLPTKNCPAVVSEVFLNGNEPVTPDNLYHVFQINRETGRLATVFTPPDLVEERTFFVLPAEAQNWARAAGLPLPPNEYDTIQAPPFLAGAAISSPAPFSFVKGKIVVQGTAGGENFSAYRLQVGEGINPRNWFQVGDDHNKAVDGGDLGEWDTRQQPDGLYALRLVLTRIDKTILSKVIQVTVDNTPPQVHILYPEAGQVFQQKMNTVIDFRVDASDETGIASLQWFVDGKLEGETRQEPYLWTWNTKIGAHTLEVKVFDNAGNETVSGLVYFNVE